MYDPRRPLHKASHESLTRSDEVKRGSIGGNLQTPRGVSATTEYGRTSAELEEEFRGLLDLYKPQKALQLRPTRPWSESPLGRKHDDDEVHLV